MQWLMAHWVEIGAALALLTSAARVIVKLTPTPADDAGLAKFINFLKLLGLHVSDGANGDKPKE